MSDNRTANHSEVLFVKDDVTGEPFPVTGDSATGAVNISGTIETSAEKASSVTLANVATSTSSATLLASNAARKKAVIVNDSTATLYVKYGATASATSYTYLLQSYDTLEEYTYTGIIDGILSTGTGTARTSEA